LFVLCTKELTSVISLANRGGEFYTRLSNEKRYALLSVKSRALLHLDIDIHIFYRVHTVNFWSLNFYYYPPSFLLRHQISNKTKTCDIHSFLANLTRNIEKKNPTSNVLLNFANNFFFKVCLLIIATFSVSL